MNALPAKAFGTDSNIVLIGMPGAGKSTIGALLARRTNRLFIDTDVFIQTLLGETLEGLIDEKGPDEFCRLEEEQILAVRQGRAVIATGGSVVYSEKAMAHLAQGGAIVYLDLPLEEIEKRLTDIAARGVVIAEGQSLRSLYEQRTPLYRKYAEMTVDCTGKSHEQIADEIIERLNRSSL